MHGAGVAKCICDDVYQGTVQLMGGYVDFNEEEQESKQGRQDSATASAPLLKFSTSNPFALTHTSASAEDDWVKRRMVPEMKNAEANMQQRMELEQHMEHQLPLVAVPRTAQSTYEP